jgi:hypothetical protein
VNAGTKLGELASGLSQLCGCCVPGCQDGFGLLGCGLGGGTLGNAGGYQDAAELGEHVLEGGFGLGVVPGLGVVVVVPGVPDDDQGAGEQGERDGALDGAGVRLRASPAPVMFLASLIATSMV